MPEKHAYQPFDTDIKVPAQPSTLSAKDKKAIINQTSSWKNGTKCKKNTKISLPDNKYLTLSDSIIRIKDSVYILHKKTIAKGGFGKIKIVENISDGSFYVAKITSELRTLREIEFLIDVGLFRGSAIRLSKSDGLSWPVIKIYILMPYLGLDLLKQLKKLNDDKKDIPSSVRLQLTGEIAWLVAKCHGDGGGLTISGLNIAHHDIKPSNIILNDQGLKLIDFGLAENNINRLTHASSGTRPYIIIDQISNLDNANKRSGEFFDLFMFKNTIYQDWFPLYSILNQDTIARYNLGLFLADWYVYHEDRYIHETRVNIKNAVTFAAISFAKLALLDSEGINRILNDKVLALVVVGLYFDTKTREGFDKWLLNGKEKINNLFSASDVYLEVYAKFVQLGLTHNFNQAIADTRLKEVLSKSDDIIPLQLKRALVCLFQRDIFDDEKCSKLIKNHGLSKLVLEAHYYDDVNKLTKLLSNSNQYEKYQSKYLDDMEEKNRLLSLTTYDINSTSSIKDNSSELLRLFSNEAEDININLLENNNTNYLSQWLYKTLINKYGAQDIAERNLKIASVLYVFLTDEKYKVAIEILYAAYCKNNNPSLQKYIEYVLNLFFTKNGILLSRLLLNVTDNKLPQDNLVNFIHNLVNYRAHSDTFIKTICLAPITASYLLEPGFEVNKLAVIDHCINQFNKDAYAHICLKNNTFLQALVFLHRFDELNGNHLNNLPYQIPTDHCFHHESIEYVIKYPELCNFFAEKNKEQNIVPTTDAHIILNAAKVSSYLNLPFNELNCQYLFLNKLLIAIYKKKKLSSQSRDACSAILRFFKGLDELKALVSSSKSMPAKNYLADLLKNIEYTNNSNINENTFPELLNTLIVDIKSLLSNPYYAESLKPFKKNRQINANSWCCSFFSSNTEVQEAYTEYLINEINIVESNLTYATTNKVAAL